MIGRARMPHSAPGGVLQRAPQLHHLDVALTPDRYSALAQLVWEQRAALLFAIALKTPPAEAVAAAENRFFADKSPEGVLLRPVPFRNLLYRFPKNAGPHFLVDRTIAGE